jgi:hypothetical protein
MTNKNRVPTIVVLMMFGTVIFIGSANAVAQTRPSVAPKNLLAELEKDDRDCVVNNGGLTKNVSAESIELTRKGEQMLVRGSGICLCGAQNCGFWIYQKKGNKTELLLQGAGATKVSAGRHFSKGFRDVISESHASATETIIRTYRYDGSRYQLQKCVSRGFFDDSGKQTSAPVERPCKEKPPRQ